MFFVLSKTVAGLLVPSNFLIVLALVGAALPPARFKRAGRRLMVTSLLLLAFVGFFPVGAVLNHVLESRFPPWNPARGAPDGIIVLGAAIDPVLSAIYGTTELSSHAERVTVAAKLAREYPKARIVYSGGNAALFPRAPAEADFVMPLWRSFGIAPDRITLETRSRNTYENALFSKRLLKPKPGEHWLLVTSADHMPRAIGCFRRVGFPVEAYPVDWTTGPRLRWRKLLPSFNFSGGLRSLDEAMHEWMGLAAYWATGRTSSFLTGPAPAQ
ncbi:MAG TPA: YdcF family protein [Pseudolabrys sp.]|nr:YdcF family protein [Pseudolabrys sp.]